MKRGELTRPRVALCGGWSDAAAAKISQTFPTVYRWGYNSAVDRHTSEIDLVLMRRPSLLSAMMSPHWEVALWSCPLIGFGDLPPPGPEVPYLARFQPSIWEGKRPSAQAFSLPPTHPTLHAVREHTIGACDDARKLCVINTSSDLMEPISRGALAVSDAPTGVLSTVCVRPSGAGLAWIQWPTDSVVEWVQAIATVWADAGATVLPGLRPWRESWLTHEERLLERRRTDAAERRRRLLAESDRELGEIEEQLLTARHQGDVGWRRLLTAQDSELVDTVARALESFGFVVDAMDAVTTTGARREDLRVRWPADPNWEAIVEIKGFKKSGGGEGDLRKLDRHVRRYKDEVGRWPAARWFVVNGQFELSPEVRQRPFASAPDVVRDFADNDDGLVVWSLDLFNAISGDPGRYHEVGQALQSGRGEFRWEREP